MSEYEVYGFVVGLRCKCRASRGASNVIGTNIVQHIWTARSETKRIKTPWLRETLTLNQ